MKKFIALLTIILLLSACTSQQSITLPTPSSPSENTKATTQSTQVAIPSDWKTYSNSAFGISFNYPPDYAEPKFTNNELIALLSPIDPNKVKNQNISETELKVEIYIQPAEPNDSWEKYMQFIEQNHKNTTSEVLDKKLLTLDGKQALYEKVHGLGIADSYRLLTNSYRITIAKYPTETSRQSEFDKILMSMKFTK